MDSSPLPTEGAASSTMLLDFLISGSCSESDVIEVDPRCSERRSFIERTLDGEAGEDGERIDDDTIDDVVTLNGAGCARGSGAIEVIDDEAVNVFDAGPCWSQGVTGELKVSGEAGLR